MTGSIPVGSVVCQRCAVLMHRSCGYMDLTFNQVVLGSSPSGLTNKINDLGLSFIIGLRPGSLMWEAAEPCAACVIFSPCAASHVAWNAAQASSRLSA